MERVELPDHILVLLQKVEAPERLLKHLQLVYSTASELVLRLKLEWSRLDINETLILFGAGTHDIGKAEIKSELYESGKRHEAVGKYILEKLGVSEAESRFALTHGNWNTNNVVLEDLLVSLADKIWKGKRVDTLEEKVGRAIADQIDIDYWEIYGPLNRILEELCLGADQRLLWQNQ